MPEFSLMAKVQPLHSEPEAELVLVDLEGMDARLTLDDGTTITFDRDELLHRLVPAHSGWAA